MKKVLAVLGVAGALALAAAPPAHTGSTTAVFIAASSLSILFHAHQGRMGALL